MERLFTLPDAPRGGRLADRSEPARFRIGTSNFQPPRRSLNKRTSSRDRGSTRLPSHRKNQTRPPRRPSGPGSNRAATGRPQRRSDMSRIKNPLHQDKTHASRRRRRSFAAPRRPPAPGRLELGPAAGLGAVGGNPRHDLPRDGRERLGDVDLRETALGEGKCADDDFCGVGYAGVVCFRAVAKPGRKTARDVRRRSSRRPRGI